MDIKSTYDCADAGIRVVVKYPACIMDNDRVRLYGKLPADVHSIARPTRFVESTNTNVFLLVPTTYFLKIYVFLPFSCM